MSNRKVLAINIGDTSTKKTIIEENSLEEIVNKYSTVYMKNMQDTYTDINKFLFLKEYDKIISCSFLFGYSDSKDCQIDILWEKDNVKNNGLTLSYITDYAFNEIQLELVKICVTNDNNELKSLVINNNYEIIDNSDSMCYYLKENPRGSK
ncbi:MAG: hypothetical protein PHQ64_00600 [Bacilli bacterium]|nr:hypothetical protein [Bacilli bacterium]